MNSKSSSNSSIHVAYLLTEFIPSGNSWIPVSEDHVLSHLQFIEADGKKWKFPRIAAHYKDGRKSHHISALFPRRGYYKADYQNVQLSVRIGLKTVQIVSIYG